MKGNSFPAMELFDESHTFKEIIYIVRLKYFIKTENKNEILNSLGNINKRVVYEILNSPKIPKTLAEDSAIV